MRCSSRCPNQPELIHAILRAVLPAFILLFVPILVSTAFATDWYVSQSGAGAQNGADAADAYPLSWINWGAAASVVQPGDTVHLCGTVSSQLGFYYSGVSGNPITLHFEPGAQLSQPGTSSGALMTIPNQSYLVIDGGSNGIIQNTDNGTNLDNHNATSGINASGSSNLEIKNLTFQNLYVHVAGPDGSTDFGSSGAVYMNGGGNNISVHDCVFHDMSECVYITTSGSGINIYNNNFYNYNHGAEGLTGNNVNIYNNTFGSTANWDTSSDSYHHDGVFPFGTSVGVNIYDNLFDGNWGANNTAHIFLDSASLSNVSIWNNVFLQYAGDYLNNGMLAGGAANLSIFNNTFDGSGVTNSLGICTSGSNMSIVNNIISGVTTFVSLGPTTAFSGLGLNNNLYANVTPGGNAPFSLSGTSYNTLTAWQTATQGDGNSSVVTSALLGSNGELQTGSPAIRAGANLSPYFNQDKNGNIRNVPWDIGAYDGPAAPVLPPVVNLHVD